MYNNNSKLPSRMGMLGICPKVSDFPAVSKLFRIYPFTWATTDGTERKEPTEAPALALPNLSNPFPLYSSERRGTVLGLLVQNLDSDPRLAAYLSNTLDPAKGWPSCLRVLVALALLLKEAQKFSFNQTVFTPHWAIDVLNSKAPHCSNNRLPNVKLCF